MWKQLRLAALAAAFASPVSASPWYAEAAYAGGQTGSVAIGYQFRPWFGVEAGYRRSEDGNHVHWDPPFKLDDSDGFEVSMRTAIEITPRFAITGRFGLYDWNGDDFVIRGPTPTLTVAERDGVSPILGAGIRVTLTEHLSLTGEFTDSEAFESTSGPSHMISAGIRASF